MQLMLGGEPSVFGLSVSAARVAGVLRVHRLRRRGHHRGGDPQPAARPAAGHPRFADHRHRAVRGGHHCAHRRWCRTTNSARCSRTAVTTATRPPWPPRSRGRRRLGGDRDRDRRAGRPDHGGAGADARPEPDHLRDEPRPAAAPRDGQGGREARHSGPDHHRRRCRGGDDRRVLRARRAGGTGQRRHAVRVRPGVHRGDRAAQNPARPGTVLQGAADAGGADPVGAGCASG